MKNKNNKNKSIVNAIINIIFTISLIILIVTIYTMYSNKDNPTEAYLFGYKPIYLATDSMQPTINKDAVAIAKKVNYEDIKVDDIIVYKIEEQLITHRVIEITDEGIKTKADNSDEQDAYTVSKENVKAKVLFTISGSEKIIPILKTKTGVTFYVIIPMIIIILSYVVYSVIKALILNKKAEKEELEEQEELNKELNDSIKNINFNKIIKNTQEYKINSETNEDVLKEELKQNFNKIKNIKFDFNFEEEE